MPTHGPADAPLPSEALLQRLAPARAVAGVPGVVAHQAADLIALWGAWEGERGCVLPPPFWATVWPAATVLARCLGDGTVPVAGRRVLEIGCGGAVVAIVAARVGAASVEANDVDPVALHVAGLNARASGVELRLSSADYASADQLPACDLLLAADLFYERTASARLLDRLRAAARGGVEVVVADAGRPFAPGEGAALLRTEAVTVDPDLEGVASRRVRLLRLA